MFNSEPGSCEPSLNELCPLFYNRPSPTIPFYRIAFRYRAPKFSPLTADILEFGEEIAPERVKRGGDYGLRDFLRWIDGSFPERLALCRLSTGPDLGQPGLLPVREMRAWRYQRC